MEPDFLISNFILQSFEGAREWEENYEKLEEIFACCFRAKNTLRLFAAGKLRSEIKLGKSVNKNIQSKQES